MTKSFKLPGADSRILPDAAGVAAAAAACIRDHARAAIAARGAFHLCVAGGSTPSAAYRLLAAADPDATAPWSAWHIYHGDERCVPATDPERNSLSAARDWLDQVPIPTSQQHPIPAEQGAEAGALAYEPVVCAALPFDLVLLGIGEDGHIASLFPGHPWPDDERLAIPVHDSPKPPPARVSLTPRALCDTRALLVLVTGSGKQDAVRRWRAGEPLPIARVLATLPALVTARVLLDAAAVGPGLGVPG